MKLRLQTNHLRLRLSRSDLAQLADMGLVEEAVKIAPGSVIVYALERDEEARFLTARLDGTRVTVSVPAAFVRQWVKTDRVGYEGEQASGAGDTLHLLIEKDFACLDGNTPDADAFPNPGKAC